MVDVFHKAVGHSLRHRPVFARNSEEIVRVDRHDGQKAQGARGIATFRLVNKRRRVAERDGREQGDWKTIPASHWLIILTDFDKAQDIN